MVEGIQMKGRLADGKVLHKNTATDRYPNITEQLKRGMDRNDGMTRFINPVWEGKKVTSGGQREGYVEGDQRETRQTIRLLEEEKCTGAHHWRRPELVRLACGRGNSGRTTKAQHRAQRVQGPAQPLSAR